MKCSSKSIRSFVSGGLWLLLLTAPLYGGPSAAPVTTPPGKTPLMAPNQSIKK